jgi:hypothetical protein
MLRAINILLVFMSFSMFSCLNKSRKIGLILPKITEVNNILTKDTLMFKKILKKDNDFWNNLSCKMTDDFILENLTFFNLDEQKIILDLMRKNVYELNAIKPNLIYYKIHPKKNNFIFKKEWDIHYIVYATDSTEILENRIVNKISPNWYHLKFRGKRYIGG